MGGSTASGMVGSLMYMAPEVISGNKYDEKVRCILIEALPDLCFETNSLHLAAVLLPCLLNVL